MNKETLENKETLGDIVQNQINNAIQTIPQPKKCTIIKNYPNNSKHVDITLPDGSTMITVPLIGVNRIGEQGILLFLDGDETKPVVVTSTTELYERFGFNQINQDKFNHAIITKGINIEYWVLANAYYDYVDQRFVKINPDITSFGIQIQAAGTYPGEEGIDPSNTSIGIWRNPKTSDVYKDTTNYDYTDMETKGWIGCKRLSDSNWIEYGVSAGWNNTLMLDSYGGVTIGGAGLEIDGNGLFPFTRLTNSTFTDSNNNTYALLGLVDNTYHTLNECDDNSTWSWFIGLKIPLSGLIKDNKNASFVVMYNDTEYTTEANKHTVNAANWHVVFEVNKNGIVNG